MGACEQLWCLQSWLAEEKQVMQLCRQHLWAVGCMTTPTSPPAPSLLSLFLCGGQFPGVFSTQPLGQSLSAGSSHSCIPPMWLSQAELGTVEQGQVSSWAHGHQLSFCRQRKMSPGYTGVPSLLNNISFHLSILSLAFLGTQPIFQAGRPLKAEIQGRRIETYNVLLLWFSTTPYHIPEMLYIRNITHLLKYSRLGKQHKIKNNKNSLYCTEEPSQGVSSTISRCIPAPIPITPRSVLPGQQGWCDFLL